MHDRLFAFIGGDSGPWRIDSIRPVVGESLHWAPRLEIVPAPPMHVEPGAGVAWKLLGVVSNIRYTRRDELTKLQQVSPPLGRPEATSAALIPIRKTAAWWDLSQDERREILEEKSSHIALGLQSLPAVARKLHHGRDLGEPFDFLTWFEYAPSDASAFEDLVAALRRTEEWKYVDREVDVRLSR